MSEIYSYMEDIMPVKRVMISLAIGIIALFIVWYSGSSSGFVREETLLSRTFSAFCFTGLASFILMMGGEEYAIYRTRRELEHFIDDAQIAETGEDFNIDEYFPKDEEPAEEVVAEEPVADDAPAEENVEPADDDSSRPLDFRRN